jgi:hypothetical protein
MPQAGGDLGGQNSVKQAIQWLKGMLWIRQTLTYLAMALILANAQCVVRCATAPCHEQAPASQSGGSAGIPPCHKHHAPNQSDTPRPCASSILLNESGPVAPRIDLSRSEGLTFTLPILAHGFSAAYRLEVTDSASPPRSADSPSHTVLRI